MYCENGAAIVQTVFLLPRKESTSVNYVKNCAFLYTLKGHWMQNVEVLGIVTTQMSENVVQCINPHQHVNLPRCDVAQ